MPLTTLLLPFLVVLFLVSQQLQISLQLKGVCVAAPQAVELGLEKTGSCFLAQGCLYCPLPSSPQGLCSPPVCPQSVVALDLTSVPNTTTDLSLRFLSPENLAYRGQEPQASRWIYLCGFQDHLGSYLALHL